MTLHTNIGPPDTCVVVQHPDKPDHVFIRNDGFYDGRALFIPFPKAKFAWTFWTVRQVPYRTSTHPMDTFTFVRSESTGRLLVRLR